MEEITTNLETLQNSMPINCTLLNIQKLKMKFKEYKLLIAELQGNYSSMRAHCEHYFDFIKSKIDAIEETGISWKLSKNHFQEAVDHIRSQIGMVLLTIKTGAA